MHRIKNALPQVLACIALAAMCFAVYWPVRHHGFIRLDDPLYVSLNPNVENGLTSESVRWAFNVGYSSNWHPLTWLSHMLDVEMFGLEPGGHHFTNLILHTLNSVLLFLALIRLLPKASPASRAAIPTSKSDRHSSGTGAEGASCRSAVLWSSFIIAALFAVHPLHVESVAWVSERKDLLSALFFLLTLWAYAKYVSLESGIPTQPSAATQVSGFRSQVFYSTSLLFFALGLMSKPMLVTLPFILLLLDIWPLGRVRFPLRKQHRRVLIEKVPFFLLTAGSCVLTLIAQRTAMVDVAGLPFGVRVANAARSYAIYLWQTVWPVDLAPFYPYRSPSPEAVAAGALVLLVITAVVILQVRKRTWLFTGWFWYLGMLVPVIGLVQVGMQAHADRYTYLPHIGVFIMAVWTVTILVANRARLARFATIAALAVVLAFALRAHDQVKLWKDNKTLFTHSVQIAEDNYQGWLTLGIDDLQRLDVTSALSHLNRALETARPFGAEPEVTYFIGAALQMQGKFVEAIPHFEKAKVLPEQQDEFQYRLGLSLIEADRIAEAEQALRKAVELSPRIPGFQLGLARALAKKGDIQEAERIARDVLKRDPLDPKSNHALASLLSSSGRPAEAQPFFETARKASPDDARLARDYAQCLGAQGFTTNAVGILEKVLKRDPQNVDVMLDMAAILDDAGRDVEAARSYERALTMKPDDASTLNNLAWLLSTSPDSSARNGKRAVELASRACEITGWSTPVLIGTLAAAYAELGDFPKAVESAAKARTLAIEQDEKVVADRNAGLIELYKSGKPFRDAK